MQYKLVTFEVGQSVTDEIVTNEKSLCGLIVSGSSMTSGSITFLVSNDGNEYYPLFDSNASEVYLKTTTAKKAYYINDSITKGWNFIKVRSGTSASAVNQATVPVDIIVSLL